MPWRQVFDAAQSKPLADRYGVQGIPFELLIGRDGTIAAVNVRGPDLDSAIDQALVKK